MTLSVELWATVGAIALAVGTVPSLYVMLRDPQNRLYYAILASITAIAAVSYAFTRFGFGAIPVGDATFYAPRYVDWLLTTPLLILYLALLCRPGKRMYALLIGLDVALITLGIAAIFTEGLLSLALFAAGCVAYGVLAYLLVVRLPRTAAFETDRVAIVFAKLRNLTVVLWTLYPVVWLLAPVGFGFLTPGTEMMVIVYLDIITKVGFALFALAGRDALDHLSADSLVQSDVDAIEKPTTADVIS